MFMSLIRSLNYRITISNVKHLIAVLKRSVSFYWALSLAIECMCHFSIYTHHSNFGHPVKNFFTYSLMRAQNHRWFRIRVKYTQQSTEVVWERLTLKLRLRDSDREWVRAVVVVATGCAIAACDCDWECDWSTMGVNYKALEEHEMGVINLHRSWNNCYTYTYQAWSIEAWSWSFWYWYIQPFLEVVW